MLLGSTSNPKRHSAMAINIFRTSGQQVASLDSAAVRRIIATDGDSIKALKHYLCKKWPEDKVNQISIYRIKLVQQEEILNDSSILSEVKMPCEISLVLCDDVRPDADEVKALFMASKFGNTEDLESLLRKGINPNRMIDVDAVTLPSPLAYASGEGHFECVTALLDARACIDDRDKYGETPLRRVRGTQRW